MPFLHKLASLDWPLTGASLLLVSLGLTMLFASAPGDPLVAGRLIRQLIALVIAFIVYLFLAVLPYHNWQRYAPWVYGFSLLSLLVVAQVGRVIRGTTSRLEFIGTQVQPSEFMKIALILILAWIFFRWPVVSRPGFLLSVLTCGLSAGLVLMEPDFGMAALMIAIWGGLVIYLGLPLKHLLVIFLIALVSFFVSWQWLFADYQKDRLQTFLDPTTDPLGAGYNVVQSLVALGSGGLLGRGLGHGPQSQLKFLPEQHTDFIFASIGEELGFAGIAVLVSLYFVLLWRIYLIAIATNDNFGQLIAVGTFLILLVSFFVSTGMNMGLLPVTGLPLSLVSYGGSNILSTFILLGLVQSIKIHNTWVRQPPIELTHFT